MKTTFENNILTQDNIVYDVVISGAGPVGLFLACELALAKCSVLILEKSIDQHSPLKQMPFGIRGLSTPTIEALYRRGLLRELEIHKRLKNPHQNAVEGSRRQVGHFAGIPFHEGDIDASQWKYRLPGSTETSLISEIAELETVLIRRALALGVEIKHGSPASGFDQTDSKVTVYAGDQSFKGKWLVGCDGARSVIRKAGGFEFAGTEPEFTGYSVKADIADAKKLKPGRNVTERGMYIQSQPGYFALQDFDGGAFHGSGKPITIGHVQDVLRRISGTDVTLTALHIATTWTDRARQATAYRNGRVFLAGDAAHIHAPLGGQGLNLGLGDAMNLGWKLAASIQNKAPKDLLDSYHAERYPVGLQVLDWSRAQAAIMKPDPDARALHAIMRDLINTPDGATCFAGRVWDVNLRYDLDNGHPLAGHSVPNFEFENGIKLGELMHDGKGVMLDFDANTTINAIANQYKISLNYVAGPVKENLGLRALLIRPDGFVAWAADNSIDMDELNDALEKWFVVNG